MKHWTTTLLAVLALTFTAAADTYVKDNNNIALTDPASWVSGSVPGAGDIALWDSTISAAYNNIALGADWTLGQIQITNSGTNVTISGANTLTLNGVGGVGIDMSASTRYLDINSSLHLGAAQTWNIANGMWLTIGGALSGNVALTVSGLGDINFKGDNSNFSGNIYWNTGATKTLALGHVNALGNAATNIYLGGGTGSILFRADTGDVNVKSNIVFTAGRSASFNTNGRNMTFSGSLVSAGGNGDFIKFNSSGTLTVSGTSNLSLNKIEVDGGEMIISGSFYATNGAKVEFSSGGGTLTVTGVFDRAGDGNALIRAISNNNTSSINVSGSGLFNIRGQTVIGTAYSSNTNNTLNINLSNSGTFNATQWLNVSPVKGQTVNLNLSGTSLFKATEISFNEGNNTLADGKAHVNVSVADNALLHSTGALHIGRTSENVETVLTQTGGTVKAQRIGLNDAANKQQNVGIYKLNGGVMLLSSDGSTRADNNNAIGTSSITVGANSFVYLNGGTIAVNGNNNASNGTASGTGRMIIQDGGVTIDTQLTGGDYGFAANLALEHGGVNAKDGGLVKTGAGTLLLNAANTYTGDTIVSGGTLILGDNASLLFKLGADGGINKIYNNGGTVTLNGSIDIDVSDYAAGSSWNLFNGSVALGNTFTVSGAWQNDGTGIWSLGTDWTFDQSSGLLNVIPEPSTLTLIIIGAGLLTVSVARRRK